MIRITKYQLFNLILLFEIGSSTLFVLGAKAKQDAWLVVILSTLIGFALLYIYTELQSHFPEKNLIEMLLLLLGRFLGTQVALLYVLFFIYAAARNLRDFGDLIAMTFLEKTHLEVIHLLIMFTGFYVLFLGVEVFGRISEIMMPWVVSFLFLTYILVIVSGKFHISQLLPVLENGMSPIFRETYPTIVNFPFGEVFVFSMYWCYVKEKQSLRKASLWAMGMAGLVIAVSTITILSVLGVDFAAAVTVPLIEVIKQINIGDIITNLEAIGIIIIFVGGFFKTMIFFHGGVLGFSTLFQTKNTHWPMIGLGIFTLWLSTSFAPSYPHHIWQGQSISLQYIHNTFDIIIPLLLLAISWLKRKSKEKK